MDVNLIIQKAIVREGLSNLNIENIQPCYIKGIIKAAIKIAVSEDNKCKCPKESTDIYDEYGNLLGFACLGCGQLHMF